jgi:ubiquinone/menaquinone biosynthesis C-methylase UbiE
MEFDRQKLPASKKLAEDSRTSTNKGAAPFPRREKCRVLILGCGNSRLGEDMMKDGWKGNICNVDFSSVVIKQMKQRYNDSLYRKIQCIQSRRNEKKANSEEFPRLVIDDDNDNGEATGVGKRGNLKRFKNVQKMTFECADVTTSLPYSDESFDLILCKGTIDAILCSNGAILKTKQMMAECHRLLHKDHGILVVVSFGTPDNRLFHFENECNHYSFDVDVHKVPKHRAGSAVEGGSNRCSK